MDLRTYLRVIWRFRLVVGAGLILAILLAGVSYFKVSFHGAKPSLAHRQSETWRAKTTVAIGAAGAPVGSPNSFSNPAAFASLAFYYSTLATSDPVEKIVAHEGPVNGTIIAQPEEDQLTHAILPFIDVIALSATPRGAVSLANREADALRTYVNRQQDAANISVGQRVTLENTSRAYAATLFAGRRKTTPVVIFLTVLIAAIGMAFILENLRPRVHVVGRDVDELPSAASQRAG